MRTTYKDILKEEINQVNVCFDEWGKTIASLDKVVKMTWELLDALRGGESE